jgi:probable phosphoglycerate mutase
MIVSSDLSRASATAAPLARLTGLEVILDKDLRERQGGRWEGLNDAEIRAQYPDAHRTWNPPDGEQSSAVAERVGAALQRIAAALADQVTGPDGLAVVVSHGAAIRLVSAVLAGVDSSFALDHHLPNAQSVVLTPITDGRWSCLQWGSLTPPFYPEADVHPVEDALQSADPMG